MTDSERFGNAFLAELKAFCITPNKIIQSHTKQYVLSNRKWLKAKCLDIYMRSGLAGIQPLDAEPYSTLAIYVANVQVVYQQGGKGHYTRFLELLEENLVNKGYTILIEGVTVPRHWAFYERLGYKQSRIPGDDVSRNYFKTIS